MNRISVLEGGLAEIRTFDLRKGRYVFFCFMADRAGGPVHTARGMVQELAVS